jgi:enediyne biosynthesis protein E4
MGCAFAFQSSFAADRQWYAEKGFRWVDLDVPQTSKTGFTILSPEETGLLFTNSLDYWSAVTNRVLQEGSGDAVGDYDNDGLPDVFICGINRPNALYKNLGNWKFKDVTKEAGIFSTNVHYRAATFADLNGDGHLDLLVATIGHGFQLYSNNANGAFTDVTQTSGLATSAATIGFTLADIDGNGTLDLFAVNSRADEIRDSGKVDLQMVNGQIVVPPALKDQLVFTNGMILQYGEPSMLFLNDAKGRFTYVSWTNGFFLDEDGKPLTSPPRDWSLTASFRDLNNDGLPDLYVCNDYWTPDRIWMNDGKGHLRAIDRLAIRATCASSMGLDVADIDRDGYMDIFATDMLSRSARLRKRQVLAMAPMSNPVGAIDNRPQIMRDTLLRNRGDGTFEEIANYANVAASDWSWTGMFLDVDLDGYEDILIPAGHFADVQDLDANDQIRAREQSNPRAKARLNKEGKVMTELEMFLEDKATNYTYYPPLHMPIIIYRNQGDCQFQEVTSQWGTEEIGIHHGLSFGDFDGDGDQDLVVNNLNAPVRFYRNNSTPPRVAVQLKGFPHNSQGVGALIKLLNGAVPMQSAEVISGGHFLSGSDATRVFAAGQAKDNMTLQVLWRSGKTTTVTGVKPNRLYEIDETDATSSNLTPPPAPAPWFADVSERLNHIHHEAPFDDFKAQPLLPKRFSQLGPGVAWLDIDKDGHDELIIGTGRGAAPAVYHATTNGTFAPMPFQGGIALPDDTTGLAAWTTPSGQPSLVVGLAKYESGTNTPAAITLSLNTNNNRINLSFQASIRQFHSSGGPLAAADTDGTGRLALFIGGRTDFAIYPAPVSSQIYRNDGRQWSLDAENSRLLENIGMVSGAVWSDLDGDALPELILATEWGPIRVFKNQAGKLDDITAKLSFDKYTGWWTGVTTGDFDGDGKTDIIAGNWGLNSPYRATPQQPLQIYYGNLSGRGITDILETEYDPEQNKVVPLRGLPEITAAMPVVRMQYPTYKAYSEAGIKDILALAFEPPKELRVTTLATMLFLNRGDHFEPVELPKETQWAPVFSVNVADLDGDGNEDLFLSQNFFDPQPEIPRLDAGRGLLLRNLGNAKFESLPGQQTGIKIYGEQRGAALGDFNEDGRVDLLVSQNAAQTKLYQNTTAKPGLRVRLAGPPGNPSAIGASIRLAFGQKLGPARELHSGSGYWSQDSLTQALATPQVPTAITIRWPGGKTTTTDLPPDAKEILVNMDGKIQKMK